MVFFTWYSLWIVYAVSVSSLIYPFLAIIARISYLNQLIPVRWFHILLVTVMFLWLSMVNTPNYAIALSFKSLLFIILTLHIAAGFGRVKLQMLPLNIAIGYHLFDRYFQIVRERIDDISYAVRIRTHIPGISWTRKIRFMSAGCMNIIIELLVLIGQITLIVNSRGDLPHPTEWKSPDQPTRWGLIIGDIVLFVIFLVMLLIGPENTIPEVMHRLVQSLKQPPSWVCA